MDQRQAGNAASPASNESRATVAAGITGNSKGIRGDLNAVEGPGSIKLTNSTDLNALAQALALTTLGESLELSDVTFTRDSGTGGISIDLGANFDRILLVKNATLTADVIKARSFQSGGRDALVIDGSRFNATQLIRLYADGDSNVRFTGNVQLNAPRVDIAGRRVTIDPNGTVTSNGSVRVFTDNADFDKPGRGSLNSSGTKEIQPHANRPRF